MTGRATWLYITRHGQTDANLQKRVQGQGDTPLNATGLSQSAELAAYFTCQPADAVFSSDLPRARQTADTLRKALGIPVSYHPELRARRMGDYENRTHAELEAADPENFRRLKHDPAFVPPGGGESTNDLRARALPFVQMLAIENPGKRLVILSHHKVCQLLIAELAGTGRMDPIPNARPATILFEGGEFRVVGDEEAFVSSHGTA
ncbi:MAG: histidine phosphatase family protein [Nitrospirota bacterium]|nr:histidine phosphatase family protein [Nitrospirota bacterium]